MCERKPKRKKEMSEYSQWRGGNKEDAGLDRARLRMSHRTCATDQHTASCANKRVTHISPGPKKEISEIKGVRAAQYQRR
jgi:hypothetical protein